MNRARINRRVKGLTVVEVLVVIATSVVLFGLLLPWVAVNFRRRICCRVNCTSHLKQIGLAYRMWANDQNDLFPMAVSTNQGGTLEFAGASEAFRHFDAISNELNSPKVLVCPQDFRRIRATSFLQTGFGNSNLSYFVNLDAAAGHPQMILTGDRNIAGGVMTNPCLLLLGSNSAVRWDKGLHFPCGNVGLSDGSAQTMTATNFRRQLYAVTNEFIRLAIPIVP